jgi:LEA14-like dessication related protein
MTGILRSLSILLILLSGISSCAIEAPEFIGSEGVKMEKMDGKEIYLSAGVKVNNPNWFGIKLKKSALDVYLEDQLHAELAEGAMLIIARNSAKENVNVRFTGKVKGGIWFFSKKIKIDETRQIPGKSLRPGGMMNIGQ